MKYWYSFFDGQFLPLVSLKLKGKEEWLEVKAFVDTGASYSLFPADVAELLGISLEVGESKEMTLGDGDVLSVYVHKLLVSIAGKEFVAPIGFSKGLGTGFYILGRKGFFDRFLVLFNESEKWIAFKPFDEHKRTV